MIQATHSIVAQTSLSRRSWVAAATALLLVLFDVSIASSPGVYGRQSVETDTKITERTGGMDAFICIRQGMRSNYT